MLEPTATAARSVADSWPAMIVSIVPLPTSARLAMKQRPPEFDESACRCVGRIVPRSLLRSAHRSRTHTLNTSS